MFRLKLVDHFIQSWFSNMCNSSRGEFYSLLKNKHCLEPYLLRLNKVNGFLMCKFRFSNVKFLVETRRWLNIPKKKDFVNIDKNIGR